jgi:hypothetical protein
VIQVAAQQQRRREYYEAIPLHLRTTGDVRAHAVTVEWLSCISWLFPGGRGKPMEVPHGPTE